jgi:hypothetical protein
VIIHQQNSIFLLNQGFAAAGLLQSWALQLANHNKPSVILG